MPQRDQIGALIESWTKSQQQIWENWMETLRKASGGRLPGNRSQRSTTAIGFG